MTVALAGRAPATFEIKSWDEEEFDSGTGMAKLTRATVEKQYSGDLEATSATEWLMAYQPDETATFVGLERIKGTIGGRHGTLVLQHVGRFEKGAATAELTVVSGTEDLDGATGNGRLVADPNGRISLVIEHSS